MSFRFVLFRFVSFHSFSWANCDGGTTIEAKGRLGVMEGHRASGKVDDRRMMSLLENELCRPILFRMEADDACVEAAKGRLGVMKAHRASNDEEARV